jgi:hypothetical protein
MTSGFMALAMLLTQMASPTIEANILSLSKKSSWNRSRTSILIKTTFVCYPLCRKNLGSSSSTTKNWLMTGSLFSLNSREKDRESRRQLKD